MVRLLFLWGCWRSLQYDIKRVIAYSTLSQLGYMAVALGASAYDAAIFHLITHAFFKALLFLAAGSVIIALHHEQDMRKMGGLGSVFASHLCDICYWVHWHFVRFRRLRVFILKISLLKRCI